MARSPHKPTEQSIAEVTALKSFGVPLDEIAVYLEIDRKTLSKHYSQQIKTAQLKANANVAKFLFSAASGKSIKDGASHADCIRAAMFWAKTRMGWRENESVEDAVIEENVIQIVRATKAENATAAN